MVLAVKLNMKPLKLLQGNNLDYVLESNIQAIEIGYSQMTTENNFFNPRL